MGMEISFVINPAGGVPVYKQLLRQFESKIKSGRLADGALVPSMNELAGELGISRETVKKVYSILRDRGYLEPRQGKGFYVRAAQESRRPSVLVLIDKMSICRQTMLNAFLQEVGEYVEPTIIVHNQNLDLYEYYLDLYLDQFDYYMVTPHFPRDEVSQRRMLKLTSRIPNRKMIVLDVLPHGLRGNFGAVYQDFENDAYDALGDGLTKFRRLSRLRVITMPTSMYGPSICKAVQRFCDDNGLNVEYLRTLPGDIARGDTFLVLNSQLDTGIADLADNVRDCGLRIGKDVFVIAYNEYPINRVVLGGLTTISTDFESMGRLAARMIVEKRMFKRKCDFGMIKRLTF